MSLEESDSLWPRNRKVAYVGNAVLGGDLEDFTAS
jgi:hypothetical protein